MPYLKAKCSFVLLRLPQSVNQLKLYRNHSLSLWIHFLLLLSSQHGRNVFTDWFKGCVQPLATFHSRLKSLHTDTNGKLFRKMRFISSGGSRETWITLEIQLLFIQSVGMSSPSLITMTSSHTPSRKPGSSHCLVSSDGVNNSVSSGVLFFNTTLFRYPSFGLRCEEEMSAHGGGWWRLIGWPTWCKSLRQD